MDYADVLRFPQLDLRGRRIFLRADLDLPVSPLGRLVDETRTRKLAPSVAGMLAAGCKVVLAGHAERQASLVAVAELLGGALGRPLSLLSQKFEAEVSSLSAGQLALAPNLSLFKEESTNDARWARRVARAFDVYVGEAPGAASQTRASTVALPRLLPARGVGQLWGRDLDMSRDFATLPESPYVALLGGAGLARKATFLGGLLDRVDVLLLGGVIANTFLVASGWDPCSSEYELDAVPLAASLAERARERGIRLLLPVDFIVDDPSGSPEPYAVRRADALADYDRALDLGPETRRAYEEVLATAQTLLWNGVLGSKASDATLAGTRELLRSAQRVPYAGVVGTHSVALATKWKLSSTLRWLATSGDAARELMVGVPQPGLESLRQPPALATPTELPP
jgi:phosphoglycerate kinase